MAITGRLVVTPEQLIAQASVVRNELSTMKAHFEMIKKQINCTASYWNGEAADAHRQAYQKQQGTIDEMFHRYQEQIRDLETIAGVYRETEQEAANAADSLPASNL